MIMLNQTWIDNWFENNAYLPHRFCLDLMMIEFRKTKLTVKK